MRSLSEFEMGRGVFDSSSDRLLLKRRSEVDEVDLSKTPPPTISEIAHTPDGHKFLPICVKIYLQWCVMIRIRARNPLTYRR